MPQVDWYAKETHTPIATATMAVLASSNGFYFMDTARGLRLCASTRGISVK